MEKRKWIESGIVEELDIRQIRLLELVLEKIRFYYRKMYQRKGNPHPLSLKTLMKLANRNSSCLIAALRLLANSVLEGDEKPPIFYDRVRLEKSSYKRPYRIFLRRSFS